MSDFLYVFRGGLENASPEQMQQHMQKWLEWSKQLADKKLFKGGEPLEKGGRVVSRKTVTDGPFAEAKDVIGGYMVIEAKDLDQAIETSRGCPILDVGGTVEVRAVAKRTM